MSRKSLVIPIVVAALFSMFSLSSAQKLVIGSTAPAFSLKDSAGNTVTLASLAGKVVLLNFWATW